MKTEPLLLKEFICSCCSLALPCKSTTEPLLCFQQSCLWTVAYWALLPVLWTSILSKKKIVFRSEKNLDFLLFESWSSNDEQPPNLWGTGNCIECSFSLYLEHSEALRTIEGTSACSLEWREGSQKATWTVLEKRTKAASCKNPNIGVEAVWSWGLCACTAVCR